MEAAIVAQEILCSRQILSRQGNPTAVSQNKIQTSRLGLFSLSNGITGFSHWIPGEAF